MEQQFEDYLFNKQFLVSTAEEKAEDAFEAVFSLMKLFNIRITKNAELAELSMIRTASRILGINVPKPFYKGFPKSVRQLSPAVILFDQLFAYFKTYGMNNFDEPQHSVMEETMERTLFNEQAPIRDFAILTEKEAEQKLFELVENLLAGTRPLSDEQFELVLLYYKTYGTLPDNCASKNTAIRLLVSTRDLFFAKFLIMSDVLKMTEELNYRCYQKDDIRQLNLKNKDRKFVTAVIDRIFLAGRCDIRQCSERKALWSGLLHHIHYKPVNADAANFVNVMRGKKNISVLSEFEAALNRCDVSAAAELLRRTKGAGAVLRNLEYLISRCRTPEDYKAVMNAAESENALILIQLLFRYARKDPDNGRVFKFTRYGELVIHRETEDEMIRRGTRVRAADRRLIKESILEQLQTVLKGRLGKVYIDPAMRKITLPLQEATSQGGYGTLPTGTRIHIPLEEGKKIRAFTYWEKVNDIDLCMIGLDSDNNQYEFSWRTWYGTNMDAFDFSGDETSGYHGGSEYFDIDIENFQMFYPQINCLIFCDNVFTNGGSFSDCICKAGYMLRDLDDSGEVFEPASVQSSFRVSAVGRFCYLFAIDLEKCDFVWLNIAAAADVNIAGTTDLSFLKDYIFAADIYSLYDFVAMCASERTYDPMEADVVVSDQILELPEGVEQIRSVDTERIIALMNQRKK